MSLVAVGIGLPVGSLIGGAVARTFGLRAPFILATILMVVACPLAPGVTRALHQAIQPAPAGGDR